MILKNWENNGTEKIGLVTPTPEMRRDWPDVTMAQFWSSSGTYTGRGYIYIITNWAQNTSFHTSIYTISRCQMTIKMQESILPKTRDIRIAQIQAIESCWNFSYVTTAVLSWHVQLFIVATPLEHQMRGDDVLLYRKFMLPESLWNAAPRWPVWTGLKRKITVYLTLLPLEKWPPFRRRYF